MTEKMDIKPWYLQFWPWVLILLPMSAVAGSLTTLWIAMQDPDGLVVDDYYKKGLAINQSLERDRIARELGIRAQLDLDPEAGLSLALDASELPEMLELHFIHATRAGQDRVVSLRRVDGGLYQAALPDLAPGRWNVHLETERWRVGGSLMAPAMRMARLAALEG